MNIESGKKEVILVTGGTGFIGRSLCRQLIVADYTVVVLSRTPESARQKLEPGVRVAGSLRELEGIQFAAVINLAGESLASARWSESSKQRFRASRITFTAELFDFFARQALFPGVLLSASAVGVYGNSGGRLLDETAAVGGDFAASLCRDWEAAAQRFAEPGVRVCIVRLGVVLERDGGALAQMLPAFRLGLGGKMGAGDHYMSWIHRRDLIRLLLFLLTNRRASGVFNGVAPGAVTNNEFAVALGAVLHRPLCLPMPAPVLRLLLGEMADALLLASQRAVPAAILSLGFSFEFSVIDAALADIFKK